MGGAGGRRRREYAAFAGGHYFDTIAENAIFEFRYDFPGWPQRIESRDACSRWSLPAPAGPRVTHGKCRESLEKNLSLFACNLN